MSREKTRSHARHAARSTALVQTWIDQSKTLLLFLLKPVRDNLAPGFPRALDISPLHAQKSSWSRLVMRWNNRSLSLTKRIFRFCATGSPVESRELFFDRLQMEESKKTSLLLAPCAQTDGVLWIIIPTLNKRFSVFFAYFKEWTSEHWWSAKSFRPRCVSEMRTKQDSFTREESWSQREACNFWEVNIHCFMIKRW